MIPLQVKVAPHSEMHLQMMHIQSKGPNYNREYGMADNILVSKPVFEWLKQQIPTHVSLATSHKYYIEALYYERSGYPRIQIRGKKGNRPFGMTVVIRSNTTTHASLNKFAKLCEEKQGK